MTFAVSLKNFSKENERKREKKRNRANAAKSKLTC